MLQLWLWHRDAEHLARVPDVPRSVMGRDPQPLRAACRPRSGLVSHIIPRGVTLAAAGRRVATSRTRLTAATRTAPSRAGRRAVQELRHALKDRPGAPASSCCRRSAPPHRHAPSRPRSQSYVCSTTRARSRAAGSHTPSTEMSHASGNGARANPSTSSGVRTPRRAHCDRRHPLPSRHALGRNASHRKLPRVTRLENCRQATTRRVPARQCCRPS
jgi:hypothetical protein